MKTRWIGAAIAMLLCWQVALAAIDVYDFSSEELRERYQDLIQELRCPKCQNQNLAGSDSMIAEDLRREIYEQIQAGKSDREITDYMLDRYGDYILYRPRLTPATLVLYAAPALFFVTGVAVLLETLGSRPFQIAFQVAYFTALYTAVAWARQGSAPGRYPDCRAERSPRCATTQPGAWSRSWSRTGSVG